MLADETMDRIANDIVAVDGVIGVTLGGSRARGDAGPDSDVDLGVYYEGSLDVAALSTLARRWSGSGAEVVGPGTWGPWVDGGGWLTIEDTAVDWLLRDVARVREQWQRAGDGEFAFHMQVGHPLGFLDVAYAGELAQARVLADPGNVLWPLHTAMRTYPPALRQAMVHLLWEAGFVLIFARKAVRQNDLAFISMALSRSLMLCSHVLYAHNSVWATNDKGLVPGVARLAEAPPDFADRAAEAIAAVRGSGEDLVDAIERVQSLVGETEKIAAPERHN
ncbi:nucleotidyltransferase domain-containing protein [Gordonia sp. ABSL1-1]|uniref:nucleotidyltransferase domain-containing protein n=1 Tax=Gordonia sp. ABSL1-1 TaxID=3053923 RepID=UPI002572C123|nr:nucleotidyltransferase domain-containing protein [Gordonia sp. ABSL1-1]MDL9935272.1 nucleotidyltransferase domain-containing protein [Gordonia sp. ABSL1-1]